MLAACMDIPDTVHSSADECLVIIPVGVAENSLHKTPTGFWLRACTVVSMSASLDEPADTNIPDMFSPV